MKKDKKKETRKYEYATKIDGPLLLMERNLFIKSGHFFHCMQWFWNFKTDCYFYLSLSCGAFVAFHMKRHGNAHNVSNSWLEFQALDKRKQYSLGFENVMSLQTSALHFSPFNHENTLACFFFHLSKHGFWTECLRDISLLLPLKKDKISFWN